MSRFIRCLTLFGALATLCLLRRHPPRRPIPVPRAPRRYACRSFPPTRRAPRRTARTGRRSRSRRATRPRRPPRRRPWALPTPSAALRTRPATSASSTVAARAMPGRRGHPDRHRAQRRALRADGRALRYGQCLRPRRLLGRDAILVHVPRHGPLERDRSGRGNGPRHGPGLHD